MLPTTLSNNQNNPLIFLDMISKVMDLFAPQTGTKHLIWRAYFQCRLKPPTRVVRIYNQQFQIKYSVGENHREKCIQFIRCIFHGDLKGRNHPNSSPQIVSVQTSEGSPRIMGSCLSAKQRDREKESSAVLSKKKVGGGCWRCWFSGSRGYNNRRWLENEHFWTAKLLGKVGI